MRVLIASLLLVGVAIAVSGPVHAQEDGTVGATVFVDPLAAQLRIRPGRIQVDQRAWARATLTNNGPAPIGTVRATLLIDGAGVAIANGPIRTLPAMLPHSSRDVEWRLCGVAPGNYLAMVVVTSSDGAGHAFRVETTAVMLEVTNRRLRPPEC